MNHEELKRWCVVLKNGGASLDEAKGCLNALLSQNNGHNQEFQNTALAELEIIYSRKQEKPPVNQQVFDYCYKTFGIFSTKDVYMDLGFLRASDKASCRMALKELADKNILARIPGKDGFFRRVDESIKVLNWKDADLNNTMDIIFPPFGFEKWVKIYPGSIIGLAGSTNSGKTGFLLNFIKGNMYQFPITYYTNELGAEELKNRLQFFHGVEWKFNVIQRSKDYADVVRQFPDQVHVIDYMAIYDQFSKIGEEIDAIFQVLRKGMAFIAFQKTADTKDSKRLMGRGGDFTAERARLYLSMDKNKLTIVKAKNWRGDVNPDGKEFSYKIVDGCHFQEVKETPPRPDFIK